jgi:dynein heavy chain
VIKLTDGNYLRTLESSIRVGNPVLVEDIGETLDPALEPVLQKAVFTQNGRTLIRLGDTDVDYDPNFKFYLTTKMPNPHYLPEVCIKVTVINFTVTIKGLEDQLLGDVVRKERPDLEEAKDRLVVSISNDKKQLQELQDKILNMLKESEGNILDDEVLIDTLNNSKITSGMISGRLEEAETTENQINSTRETYRAAAVRGSILYFVIADLALIGPMYQYSLNFFMRMFNDCIVNSRETSGNEQRRTRRERRRRLGSRLGRRRRRRRRRSIRFRLNSCGVELRLCVRRRRVRRRGGEGTETRQGAG